MIFCSILVLTGISYLKFGLTGNIRVDHNPFPAYLSYPVFFLFVFAIALFGWQYWKLIWNQQHTKKNYKTEAYVIVILASCMLPFLSNDVIIYLGHGYLSNHGIDVFANLNILPQSAWAPYIEDWKDGPFVYGPINLIPAKLANLIGGEHLWLTFLSYKILMLLVAIGIIELLHKIVTEPQDLLIAVLAPAFWLHNVGHMHNDIIACLLVLTAVFFSLKKQIMPASVFMGIALSCKVSVIMYLPFIFTLYYFTAPDTYVKRVGNIVISLLLLVISVVGCYAIFYDGGDSITVPFNYLSKQYAAKSFAEILGEMLNMFFTGVNQTNINEEFAMSEIPVNDPKVYWWGISKTIFNVVGILMFIITTSIFVYKTKLKFNRDLVIEYFTKLSFIFFFIYLHIFHAWYLALLIPLISIVNIPRIKKYFMVLAVYSGIHTIIITIARPSALYFVLPVLVIINAGLFLWQFRKNYLTVETHVSKL